MCAARAWALGAEARPGGLIEISSMKMGGGGGGRTEVEGPGRDNPLPWVACWH